MALPQFYRLLVILCVDLHSLIYNVAFTNVNGKILYRLVRPVGFDLTATNLEF